MTKKTYDPNNKEQRQKQRISHLKKTIKEQNQIIIGQDAIITKKNQEIIDLANNLLNATCLIEEQTGHKIPNKVKTKLE